MPMLVIGENFPAARLQDIGGKTVEFPAVFAGAPASAVFSTVAAGDPGAGPR